MLVLFAGLFFGLADAVAVRLQTVTDIPPSLVQFLPNAAAIAALILVGLGGGVRRLPGLRTRTPTTVKSNQGQE